MDILSLLVPSIAAAILSYSLTPVARRIAIRVGIVDLPGPRKLHQIPVPRIGGVPLALSVLLVLCAVRWTTKSSVPDELTLALVLGVLPVFAVSIWDDLRGLGRLQRLVGHVAGAAIAVACGVSLGESVHLFGYSLHIGFLSTPITLLWIVGVTN